MNNDIYRPILTPKQIIHVDTMTQEWIKDYNNIKYNDKCKSGDVWWLWAIREMYYNGHDCELSDGCDSKGCSLGTHYGPYSYDDLCSLDADLYDPYFDKKITWFYKLERNKKGNVVCVYLQDIDNRR